jgi:hypothetical protein
MSWAEEYLNTAQSPSPETQRHHLGGAGPREECQIIPDLRGGITYLYQMGVTREPSHHFRPPFFYGKSVSGLLYIWVLPL